MIHMSRNTSFNWRLCHMPYASNKNKRWYNPKNTCGKHDFIQARSRNSKAEYGWMLCFTKRANQTQTYAFCTHTTLLGSTHSLDEDWEAKVLKFHASNCWIHTTKVKLKLWTTVTSIKPKCGGTERHLTSSYIQPMKRYSEVDLFQQKQKSART